MKQQHIILSIQKMEDKKIPISNCLNLNFLLKIIKLFLKINMLNVLYKDSY